MAAYKTDYKQLCAELLAALENEGYANWVKVPDEDELCLRARAALAEPEPEGPTDEELLEAVKAGVDSFPPRHPEALNLSAVEYEVELEIRKARAVLARCGRPAPAPADGEAAELVVWLRSLEDASAWFESGSPEALKLTRAADLLEQRQGGAEEPSVAAPVASSEEEEA